MIEIPMIRSLLPAYKEEKKPICVCFASDNNYAPYLRVVLYSLLYHADKKRCYDIIIMSRRISKENQEKIRLLQGFSENIKIRFLDMTPFDKSVESDVGGYYTTVTNYRLYLVSDLFCNYSRILYLDCDLIVHKDISELYDIDLAGYPIGAAIDYSLQLEYCVKNPVVIDQIPYNLLNYCMKYIGINKLDDYFNAGVLLFDLEQMRKITNEKMLLEMLKMNHFHYNDQDTLNKCMKGNFYPLDIRWNYEICYHQAKIFKFEGINEIMNKVSCELPFIVHYMSRNKPWSNESVDFAELYQFYEEKLALGLGYKC